MDLHDLQKELSQIVEKHKLIFAHNALEGGTKLENLVSKAFIAGKRKANLEHIALKEE